MQSSFWFRWFRWHRMLGYVSCYLFTACKMLWFTSWGVILHKFSQFMLNKGVLTVTAENLGISISRRTTKIASLRACEDVPEATALMYTSSAKADLQGENSELQTFQDRQKKTTKTWNKDWRKHENHEKNTIERSRPLFPFSLFHKWVVKIGGISGSSWICAQKCTFERMRLYKSPLKRSKLTEFGLTLKIKSGTSFLSLVPFSPASIYISFSLSFSTSGITDIHNIHKNSVSPTFFQNKGFSKKLFFGHAPFSKHPLRFVWNLVSVISSQNSSVWTHIIPEHLFLFLSFLFFSSCHIALSVYGPLPTRPPSLCRCAHPSRPPPLAPGEAAKRKVIRFTRLEWLWDEIDSIAGGLPFEHWLSKLPCQKSLSSLISSRKRLAPDLSSQQERC